MKYRKLVSAVWPLGVLLALLWCANSDVYGEESWKLEPGWNLVSVGKKLDGLTLGEVRLMYPAISPKGWRWRGRVYRQVAALNHLDGTWIFSGSDVDIDVDLGIFPLEYLVIDVSAGPSAVSYPVSYLSAVPAGGLTDDYKTTRIVLRRIPAGTFIMGSPEDELGREPWDAGSETQRSVTLNRDFYIGVFQVTQKQWERVMGNWPSYFSNTTYRDARPVEGVSWNDIRGGTWPGSPAGSGQPAAGTFIRRLRDRTGLSFDLPTEAQWEYACRAGTTTALNSGKNLTATGSCPNMNEVGRYHHNHPGGYSSSSSVDTTGGTAKVGSYLPNAWGLYDMHGNVWEWCLDWYVTSPAGGADPLGAGTGSSRVYRGGSCYYLAQYCRSASRYWFYPSYRLFGFRVCSAPLGQ